MTIRQPPKIELTPETTIILISITIAICIFMIWFINRGIPKEKPIQ